MSTDRATSSSSSQFVSSSSLKAGLRDVDKHDEVVKQLDVSVNKLEEEATSPRGTMREPTEVVKEAIANQSEEGVKDRGAVEQTEELGEESKEAVKIEGNFKKFTTKQTSRKLKPKITEVLEGLYYMLGMIKLNLRQLIFLHRRLFITQGAGVRPDARPDPPGVPGGGRDPGRERGCAPGREGRQTREAQVRGVGRRH